jgi:hypothetical protein
LGFMKAREDRMTDIARAAGNGQSALWNGSVGRSWVDAQELLDGMFRPLEELLVKSVGKGAGCSVLDIGCGTGATVLATISELPCKRLSVCTERKMLAPSSYVGAVFGD